MLGKSTAVQALPKLQLSQEIVHHLGDLTFGTKAHGASTTCPACPGLPTFETEYDAGLTISTLGRGPSLKCQPGRLHQGDDQRCAQQKNQNSKVLAHRLCPRVLCTHFRPEL